MRQISTLLTGLVFFLVSCGEEAQEEINAGPTFPSIEKSKLLVIHHDRDGSLIHYLAPDEITDEMLIRVKPTKDDQDLYVTVLGMKRHDLLKRSFTISSKVGDGFLGQIDVIIENGLAISINGNGFDTPALVSHETLKFIDDRLAGGKSSSEGISTIVIEQEGGE